MAAAFTYLIDKDLAMNGELHTRCPNCDATNIETVKHVDKFLFRSGGQDYEVSATIPVRTCQTCGEEFVDAEAEDIRHEATCRAIGRLTPKEIRSLRERLGVTRRVFAERTGLGEASLARWENGELIQSESNDNLMRLTEIPGVIPRLERLRRSQKPARNFPALGAISNSLLRGRELFQLRKAV